MDAETLLSFTKPRIAEIDVRPLGKLSVRLLTAGQAMGLMAKRPDTADGKALTDWMVALVEASLIDAAGKPLLTAEQAAKLADWPLDMMNDVTSAILDANGMGAETAEDRAKN